VNRDTKPLMLPSLTAHLLQNGVDLVDNLFADLWKQVGMKGLIQRAGFAKRSGTPAPELVYALLLWVWLKVDSIGLFARESLQTFCAAEKDALYGAMNREDWDWRRLHREVALRAQRSRKGQHSATALVLDDSIKTRYGRKMPGVSSHFDHTTGRKVMGQQVLTLGLSSAAGFVPIDSELFISEVKAQGLSQPFQDGRSIVAKRYRVARDQTKLEMAEAMIQRAQRAGFVAKYLVGDAWFGNKAMIRTSEAASLIPILRMKKDATKYRWTSWKQGQAVSLEANLKTLYRACVRGHWEKIPGHPYQAKVLDAELNVASDPKATPQWRSVRLLFVRGVAEAEKSQPSQHDYAVFLTTDRSLSASDILEVYALRWAIEVYFREAKQHLGFLKEQSGHYAAYIASIHLAAIRFCLLVLAQGQQPNLNLAGVRQQLSDNATHLDFAARLWSFFRALISRALEPLIAQWGELIPQVMDAIDLQVNRCFVQALQLEPQILRLEAT
jgi:hypothetical protein